MKPWIIAAATLLFGSGLVWVPLQAESWLGREIEQRMRVSHEPILVELRVVREQVYALTVLVKEIRDREILRGK